MRPQLFYNKGERNKFLPIAQEFQKSEKTILLAVTYPRSRNDVNMIILTNCRLKFCLI